MSAGGPIPAPAVTPDDEMKAAALAATPEALAEFRPIAFEPLPERRRKVSESTRRRGEFAAAADPQTPFGSISRGVGPSKRRGRPVSAFYDAIVILSCAS